MDLLFGACALRFSQFLRGFQGVLALGFLFGGFLLYQGVRCFKKGAFQKIQIIPMDFRPFKRLGSRAPRYAPPGSRLRAPHS